MAKFRNGEMKEIWKKLGASEIANGECVALGARLRRFGQDLGWTLEQASQATGVSRPTLSKIGNGQMSPTFDLLRRLTTRMQIVVVDVESSQEPRGRRSLTLSGQGKRLSGPTHVHELLTMDVSHKKMLPVQEPDYSALPGRVRRMGCVMTATPSTSTP